MLAIDIVASGLALSAARRHADFAACCCERLRRAFAASERVSIDTLGPFPPLGFTPIGWDGPSLAHTLHVNAAVLHDLDAWDLKGPKLCRAVTPLCTPLCFATELHRRLRLWAPRAFYASISVDEIIGFLPVLSSASTRDKHAWLRFVQNVWATRGRFMHNYNQCLVCGSHADRLVHLIVCKPFWRPVFALLGVGGGRRTMRGLLLSPESARVIGLGFRSHAALRGCPVPSAGAWAEQVRASV